MTLGDIIKQYRTLNNFSMDAFSEKSGISKAYISLLEKNKHPKTGKPIAPSIQSIKQAADGMDMDFNKLFSMLDSTQQVSLTDDVFSLDSISSDFVLNPLEKQIILEYRKADQISKAMVLRALSIDESLYSKGDAERMA